MYGVAAVYFRQVWCFSVDNFGDPQALCTERWKLAADGLGADGWRATPDFKTTLRRREVEGWPARLELLQLAENVLPEILDGAVVIGQFRIGPELSVEPVP